MTETMLRVGAIGLGNVAIAHLNAYRALRSIEVVAGADPRQDRLEQVATAYRFRPYSDYEEMLTREQLDIVCVFTPARTHPAVTEAAARQGAHVLCEKPMAVNLADAAAMMSACENGGVKFFYGASYRFLPALAKARELIQAGAIGDVQLLTESQIGGSGPHHYEDMGPHHYDVGGPGGSGSGLVDHGIHLVDTFSWLINSDITSVFGRGAFSGGNPISEFLLMNFENGASGQLLYNSSTFSSDLPSEGIFGWSSEWKVWDLAEKQSLSNGVWVEHPGNIRVHGTGGALRVFHYANHLFLVTKGRLEQIRIADHPMPGHFGLQMESFVESIRDGREPATTGRDGWKALRAVLGAYESFEKKRVVSFK
jgi:predicted dehydrogenase